jgi:hypothetical protein
MPAKRLPWLKFWPEAVDHEKFAGLSDAERWTWVKLLARAAQQPTRGRFASIAHAVEATGRPAKHVRTLVEVRLLDQREDGLWLHDWLDWQRWRRGVDDATETDTTTESLANDSRTSAEGPSDQQGIDAPAPPQAPQNGRAIARPKKGDERSETVDERRQTGDIPPAPAEHAPTGGAAAKRERVQKPKRQHEPVDGEYIESLVERFSSVLGGPLVVREEIEKALNHKALQKAIDQRKYLANWLNQAVRFAAERRGTSRPRAATALPVTADPDIDSLERFHVAR